MKLYLILISILIAGCTTLPAKPEWPRAPNVGTCPELDIATTSDKLSDLLSTITTNYGKYHECAERVKAWQSWYTEQEKIYKESK
jgi:hypothetical protein